MSGDELAQLARRLLAGPAFKWHEWDRYEALDSRGTGGCAVAAALYMESMRAQGWASVVVVLAPDRVVVHSVRERACEVRP